jgi:hypothetical protein
MWPRRRHHAQPPSAPAEPSPDEVTVDLAVRAAAERAAAAGRMLEQARAREPHVRARVRSARRQLARNGLGELFDQALGMGPGRGGVGA